MPITHDTGSANTLAVASTTVTTDSITTAEADELLILFFFGGDNNTVNAFTAVTSPTNQSSATGGAHIPNPDFWGEVADNTTTTGADTGNAFAHAVKTTAGATGTLQTTATMSAQHGLIVGAFKLPASGTSAALTGSSTSVNAGTTLPAIDLAISGTSSATQAGSITGQVEQATTGSASTISSGTLSIAVDLAINGVAVTTSIGTVTPAIDAALFGASSASQTGTVTNEVAQAITGSQVAASAGTLTGSSLQPRYARPESDVSQGLWLPSTGSDLFAMVDEEPFSDTDYIYANSATSCELALQGVQDPGTSSNQIIRYRARSDNGSTLIATLKQGTTTIATRTHANLTANDTEYTMTLTAGECDAITDYTALSIVLEAAA